MMKLASLEDVYEDMRAFVRMDGKVLEYDVRDVSNCKIFSTLLHSEGESFLQHRSLTGSGQRVGYPPVSDFEAERIYPWYSRATRQTFLGQRYN